MIVAKLCNYGSHHRHEESIYLNSWYLSQWCWCDDIWMPLLFIVRCHIIPIPTVICVIIIIITHPTEEIVPRWREQSYIFFKIYTDLDFLRPLTLSGQHMFPTRFLKNLEIPIIFFFIVNPGFLSCSILLDTRKFQNPRHSGHSRPRYVVDRKSSDGAGAGMKPRDVSSYTNLIFASTVRAKSTFPAFG